MSTSISSTAIFSMVYGSVYVWNAFDAGSGYVFGFGKCSRLTVKQEFDMIWNDTPESSYFSSFEPMPYSSNMTPYFSMTMNFYIICCWNEGFDINAQRQPWFQFVVTHTDGWPHVRRLNLVSLCSNTSTKKFLPQAQYPWMHCSTCISTAHCAVVLLQKRTMQVYPWYATTVWTTMRTKSICFLWILVL